MNLTERKKKDSNSDRYVFVFCWDPDTKEARRCSVWDLIENVTEENILVSSHWKCLGEETCFHRQRHESMDDTFVEVRSFG